MSMRLARNAGWAVAEVVVSGLSLLLIYKLIVAWLGIEALGIWALVLATTSLARFADIGASAGLGRFVALAEARGDRRGAIDYIETAVLSNAALYVVLALALVYPASWGIAYIVPTEAVAPALGLLPYAFVSLVLQSINNVLFSSLIGLHRTDQKSVVVIFGVVAQLLGILAFVRSHGLVGLAWAQIAQYAFTIVATWLVLQRNLSRGSPIRPPMRWKKKIFRELVGFGIRLQAASLLNLSFDVVVKFVMSAIAGLEMLGLFEMASRMVLQIRQIIAAPSQILMPAFAQVDAESPKQLPPLYEKAAAVTAILAIPLMLAAILVSPIVSFFWLRHLNPTFLSFVGIIALAWLINVLCIPGYHLGIARGIVGWNIVGHTTATIGGGILALLFGYIFGGIGVAVGAYMMLALGALISLLMNCRAAGIQPLPSRKVLRIAIADLLERACERVRLICRSRA